jgi:uncharacterized membrane protein
VIVVSQQSGKLSAFFVALALISSSCAYHQAKEAEGGDQPGTVAADLTVIPGFAMVRDQVFGPSCVGCHGSTRAAKGVKLDTYATASQFLDRIQARALNEQTMPPAASLSPAQKSLLKRWLDAGAPEQEKKIASAETPAPETPAAPTTPPTTTNPPTLTPNPGGDLQYELVRKPIFEAHCTGCHNGHDQFSLQSYDAIKANISLIKTQAVDKKSMPPDDSGDLLSESELNTLKTWIEKGALQ